jgi:hypothetical protein
VTTVAAALGLVSHPLFLLDHEAHAAALPFAEEGPACLRVGVRQLVHSDESRILYVGDIEDKRESALFT